MAAQHGSDSEVSRLSAHNQALAEELAQCQADKEFVWSLWKRLQVANPDISQAISMVVQREKEKGEQKDRKILEILQAKDDRIAELEQHVSLQEEKLQEVAESERSREEIVSLKRQFMQVEQDAKQQVEEHREKIQRLEAEREEALSQLISEKNVIQQECDKLRSRVEESQAELKAMKELNQQYEAKVQDLQRGLEEVVEKAKLASQELDDKTKGLQRAQSKLQEVTAELKRSDHALHTTRREYEELKQEHEGAMHQAGQQAQLISQLQALQADTQKVLQNQESAHTMEATSFQTMYHELRARYESLLQSEHSLTKELAEVKGQRRPVRHVALQVNLGGAKGQSSKSGSRQKAQLEVWDNFTSERIVQKESSEVTTHVHHHHELDRATSTPVKAGARRARSLSPPRTHNVDVGDGRDDDLAGRGGSGRISEFLDAAKGRRENRKEGDLRKLLRLKSQENDELRRAHSRRLERLKTLQAAYDILKEQIKTYEHHESEQTKSKKKVKRSEARDLRREDSDGVWNELAYYKQQTANLMQEKMNIEEEMDRLRVQAGVDATTIEELTRCLEDERQGLESHLARLQAANRREEREKSRAEDLSEKNKRLQKKLTSLQAEKTAWTEERDQLERKVRSLRADLVQAKTVATHREVEYRALQEEVAKLQLKMKDVTRQVERTEEERWEMMHSTRRQEEKGSHEVGSGVHIIISDNEEEEEEEEDTDSSLSEISPVITHSTPNRPTRIRRSQSMSPPRSSSRASSRRARHSSGHGSSTLGRSSRGMRSSSMGSPSPSKRQLESVLHHLDRMAKAYEESPAFTSLLMSVATQTERVVYAESGVMTETEGSDVASTSTEGAIFPGIQGISPISKRRDIATSPIKSLNVTSQPSSKKSARGRRGQSPVPGGTGALKRRLGALQQQVSTLQEQRTLLQRAAADQKRLNETLQADLNLATARHNNFKITIQRLTSDLEDAKKQKDLLLAENEDLAQKQTERHTDADWRSSEARLKSQASEIVRQGSMIKALKSQADDQRETIKSLESRIQHLDRDVSQKRSLIDDLRARNKSAGMHDKIHAETVEVLETKVSGLTETLEKKKVEIDSLRKRVAVVTREKHHYEQQVVVIQTELDKKAAVLADTLAKLKEADSTLSEVEAAASEQLHKLADQSELALDAAHAKIKQLQARVKDLEKFIKDLASEFSSQTQDALEQVLNSRNAGTTPSPDRGTDQSMVRAQSLASSILNLSTSDLEEFMAVEQQERRTKMTKELELYRTAAEEWKKRIETALDQKKLPRKELGELFLKKLREKDEALIRVRESR
ncbi:centlein-like [Diadema setosum]|uniref:centlein-like n=1 Tax=Diadema setosum TaxID=31175 RepID=UPI003B3A74BC